ncbi:hypothetical protein BJX99DRAFT_229640 [Aspergillus californicus]
MSPNHLLRAMQPLRSSIRSTSILSTQTPAALECNKPTLISRRFIASTFEPTSQQEIPESSTRKASAVPPSLRQYPYSLKKGTVVSVGRMDRTVRVEYRHTSWDSYLRKDFPKITTYLVSDPQNSLREGDVVEFSSGSPKSRQVRHVVERIITPFGDAIEDRPAVMSREERDAVRVEKRTAKAERREQRALESGTTTDRKDHVGRIRRLVLERTGRATA